MPKHITPPAGGTRESAFFVPLSQDLMEGSGQAARVLVGLCRRAGRNRLGQIDLDDFCRTLRMGHQTAMEALQALEDAGLVRTMVRFSLVSYEILPVKAKRFVKVAQWAGQRLETMAPGTVLAWLAIQWHMNPRDRLCWPSKLRLAGLINRCKRTVERAVRALTESGVLIATKLHWTKVPGFRWPAWKWTSARRFAQNRITIYAGTQAMEPTSTLTVSPDRAELCRGVIRALQNEACSLAQQDKAPEPQDGKPHGIWADLKAVGFGYGQIAWMIPRFGAGAILEAIRRLNERWATVKDRKKYVLSILWRRCERLPA